MESLSLNERDEVPVRSSDASVTLKSDVIRTVYLPKSLFIHRTKKHGLDITDLKNLPSSSAETPDEYFEKLSMTPVKD